MSLFSFVRSGSRGYFCALVVIALAIVAATIFPAVLLPQGGGSTPGRTLRRLGNLPVTFAPNLGQAAPTVRYVAHSAGATLLFAHDSYTLLPNQERPPRGCLSSRACNEKARSDPQPQPHMTISFVSANPDAQIDSGPLLPGKNNYITGDDPAHWHTELPTFSAITYRSLYSGIDATFQGTGARLQTAFTVAPGADASQIEQKGIDPKTLLLSTPVAWQDGGFSPVFIPMGYVPEIGGALRLKAATYDKSRPLHVVSTLTYSTYLGGAAEEMGTLIAVGGDGSTYITGITHSLNYPLLNAAQPYYGADGDVFVSKVNPAGNALVYSTYLGGNGHDIAWGIIVDGEDSCYLSGITASTDFPHVNAYQAANRGGNDAFLTKLSPSGSTITYSTYLGGTADDEAWALAVRGTEAYVAGTSKSLDFPLHNPLQPANAGLDDIFVTRFTGTGAALVFSTYLGGSQDDSALGIAVDGAGNSYFTGGSYSIDFPLTTAGYQPYKREGRDVIEGAISADGSSLIYTTFLGGNDDDLSFAVAVTPQGEAVISGFTASTDFPVRHAVQSQKAAGIDSFITKFSPTGGWIIYSTYLGGDGDFDAGYGIALDPNGNAISSGTTDSTNYPTVNPIQVANGGESDVFLSIVGPYGQPLLFSSYLGGSHLDFAWGAAADLQGIIYTTGEARSADFPVQNPLQAQSAGEGDNIIVKINPASGPTATPPTCTVSFSDVPVGSPFYQYIHCLACDGVISGYGDNSFRPGSPMTRGQLAKIVSNAVAFSDPVPEQVFEDVPPGSAFFNHTGRLAYRGSIAGYPCGSRPNEPCVPPYNRSYFEPNSQITRGQAAKIVAFTAAYNQPHPSVMTFEDVAPYSTFHTWIEELSLRGLISGYPCGAPGEPCVPPNNRPYYRPSRNVTRGQAAKIVGNVFYSECVNAGSPKDGP